MNAQVALKMTNTNAQRWALRHFSHKKRVGGSANPLKGGKANSAEEK